MRENFSLSEETNKKDLIYKTCTLSKGYTITIPKSVRETLNFISGDEITISLTSKNLIIRKLYDDMLENKMILTDRGAVKIPQEFIELLSLEEGDQFKLCLTNNSVLLRKQAKM